MEKQTKSENQVCGLCGSKELETEKDVGSDIDEGGEEKQHIERCKSCGAWRFNIDRWENFTDYKKYYGKWHSKETKFFEDMSNKEIKNEDYN